jgi:hypothetical protein
MLCAQPALAGVPSGWERAWDRKKGQEMP